jgi:hypothetical protein
MAISEKNIPQNLVPKSLSATVQFVNDEFEGRESKCGVVVDMLCQGQMEGAHVSRCWFW